MHQPLVCWASAPKSLTKCASYVSFQPTKERSQNLWPLILVEGEEHYKVAGILDSKLKHKTLFYLIKWMAFPFRQSKWVKARDIKAPHLVATFHKKYLQNLRGGGLRGAECHGWYAVQKEEAFVSFCCYYLTCKGSLCAKVRHLANSKSFPTLLVPFLSPPSFLLSPCLLLEPGYQRSTVD